MTVALVKALEGTSSRNEKEDIIKKAFLNGERNFFFAARFAYDPIVTFGVKKVPKIEDEDNTPGTLSFDSFMTFAHRLRRRELTGHAARDALIEAANRANVDEWNYFYRRMLLKDFKIGCDHSTINKVLKAIGGEALDYLIPVFSCQLAQSGAEHPKKMVGSKFLDLKFNGARLLTVIDIENKTVRQYTRNGNLNENFVQIREQLERLIPDLPMSVVFDGEVIGATFQKLMSQMKTGGANTIDNKLMLFDMVPLKEFTTGKCAITQRKRHETLVALVESGLFQKHDITAAEVLPKMEVELGTPEGQAKFEAYREEVLEMMRAAREIDPTDDVIEGIMIKDVDAPYVCKKGTHWLKWKPFVEVTLEVIGVEQGKPDGKYAHTLGALICRGFDEGRIIETNVATGMSDEDRDAFWADSNSIIGYLIEVRADAFTQNDDTKGSDVWSLRFPSFKGKRGFKPGEKI